MVSDLHEMKWSRVLAPLPCIFLLRGPLRRVCREQGAEVRLELWINWTGPQPRFPLQHRHILCSEYLCFHSCPDSSICTFREENIIFLLPLRVLLTGLIIRLTWDRWIGENSQTYYVHIDGCSVRIQEGNTNRVVDAYMPSWAKKRGGQGGTSKDRKTIHMVMK